MSPAEVLEAMQTYEDADKLLVASIIVDQWCVDRSKRRRLAPAHRRRLCQTAGVLKELIRLMQQDAQHAVSKARRMAGDEV